MIVRLLAWEAGMNGTNLKGVALLSKKESVARVLACIFIYYPW